MHELTATSDILDIALCKAEQMGATRVTKVSLRIGEWSTFEPECIRFYFGILAKGTLAEHAELAVEKAPVMYTCEACGLDYKPDNGAFSCPNCSDSKGRLIGGREFLVESIEVYHANPGSAESPGGE